LSQSIRSTPEQETQSVQRQNDRRDDAYGFPGSIDDFRGDLGSGQTNLGSNNLFKVCDDFPEYFQNRATILLQVGSRFSRTFIRTKTRPDKFAGWV